MNFKALALTSLIAASAIVGGAAQAGTRAGWQTMEFPHASGRDSVKVIDSNRPGIHPIHELIIDCNAGQILLSRKDWAATQVMVSEADQNAIAADYCAAR